MANVQVAEGHRIVVGGDTYEYPAKVDIDDADQVEALISAGHVTKPGRQQQADDPNTGEGTDGQGGATDQQSDGSRRRVQRT